MVQLKKEPKATLTNPVPQLYDCITIGTRPL
jgi:hypothetical protein